MDLTREDFTDQAAADLAEMANKKRNAPPLNGDQPKMRTPFYHVGKGHRTAMKNWVAHLKRAGKGKARPQDAGHRDLTLWFVDGVEELFPEWALDEDEPVYRKLEHIVTVLEVAELAKREPVRLFPDGEPVPPLLIEPMSMPPVSSAVPPKPKRKPVTLDTLALAARGELYE